MAQTCTFYAAVHFPAKLSDGDLLFQNASYECYTAGVHMKVIRIYRFNIWPLKHTRNHVATYLVRKAVCRLTDREALSTGIRSSQFKSLAIIVSPGGKCLTLKRTLV